MSSIFLRNDFSDQNAQGPDQKKEESKSPTCKQLEIPSEVLLKAQRDVEEFFKSDLPDVCETNMQWVMERMAPIMAKEIVKTEAVNEKEVHDFLDNVENDLEMRIEEVNQMNFSRGHELSEKTYPSVDEMEPLASWIKSLSKSYSLYRKVPKFKERFTALFSQFVEVLLLRVKNQALRSRHAQLEGLHLRRNAMDKNDFQAESSLIEIHIDVLQEKKEQPLLELRDLLNLSKLPWLKREPTWDEQQAFQFLCNFV